MIPMVSWTLAGRAPGRPKPARASPETGPALRPSFPSGDRPAYTPGEGQT